MLQIAGHITHITFEKPNFRIAKFRQDPGGEISIKGYEALMPFEAKQPIILYGDWQEYKHPKKETVVNEFVVEAAFFKQPTDLPSLETFLACAVPGCGPVKAKAMVRKHGASLFDYLREGRSDKLIEVKGIAGPTAERIVNGFQARSVGYYITEFLCSVGVKPEWTDKVQRTLGPDAVRQIRKNPYILTRVSGIGYQKADGIALKLGWKQDSIERAEATLYYTLEQAATEGHSFLTRDSLIEGALKEMLKSQTVSAEDPDAATPAADPAPALSNEQLRALLNKALDACYEKTNSPLVKDGANTSAGLIELSYMRRLYSAEVRLARKIRVLLESKPVCRYKTEQLTWIIKESEKALDIELTEEQRSAIVNAFQQPVSILTGGPGTGKTATMRVLVNVAKRIGYTLSLCAPTGRAAKHLSNVTEEPALTIHRLLDYNAEQDRWRRNENDQLATGMVISDEVSMVDIELASHIADAIKPGTPWLIIGDKDQLPAVSPGRVLEDLINCKQIPVTRLTKIFRQAEKSLIVQNAYRILNGEQLRFPPPKQDAVEMADCYQLDPPVIPALDEKGKQKKNAKGRPSTIEDYEWIKSRILTMCKDRIPKRMKLNPIRDVQVLTPMREKGLGAKVLNETLQDALNPLREGIEEVVIGVKRFRTGDRVQQHRNNYRLGDDFEGVYNGDIGFIRRIDKEEGILEIDFGGAKPILYPFDDAKVDLHLGYAMTVHRSQGGEFPVVIVVLLAANSIMLQRNLLYTAVTRAKQLLVFVSQNWVLNKAVKNSEIQKRNSFLLTRIRREVAASKTLQAAS